MRPARFERADYGCVPDLQLSTTIRGTRAGRPSARSCGGKRGSWSLRDAGAAEAVGCGDGVALSRLRHACGVGPPPPFRRQGCEDVVKAAGLPLTWQTSAP